MTNRLRGILVGALLVLTAPAPFAGCGSRAPVRPRTLLRLASGPPGDTLAHLGSALAEIYHRDLPEIDLRRPQTDGSLSNAQAIEHGQADVGFVRADIAYVAFDGGLADDPVRHDKLRGIAVLHVSAAHLLVRAGARIHRIAELRGARIAVIGHQGTNTEFMLRIILEAHGVSADQVRTERLPFGDVGSRLQEGALDAAFAIGRVPVPQVEQALQEQPAQSPSQAKIEGHSRLPMRLLSVDDRSMNKMRKRYPFLRPFVIAPGSYPNQHDEVRTVGVEMLLVCSSSLGEDLVYRLTRAMFNAQVDASAPHLLAVPVDLEVASATPIPLHPGAARFYREQTLFR